jgi:hypothetical protein
MGDQSVLPALIPAGGRRDLGVVRLAWLLLCVLAILAGGTSAFPGDMLPSRLPGLAARAVVPRLVLGWRDGFLSVSAHAIPWEEVLPGLEHQIGIPIRGKGPLAGMLTQEFVSLPLEQGLRRLFRALDLLIQLRKG